MHYTTFFSIILVCLLSITGIKTEEDYGLYHYNFDHDPLIDNCTKEKPLIFHLMVDFLTMVKQESNPKTRTQQCVIEGQGPGFTTPPGVARNIFAMTRIVYNTYARYSQQAQPATMYDGWTRMLETQQKVPDCVYIYGFYHIAHFLMPERVANYTFKDKYEANYRCNLTQISADTNSDLGLVQRDVEQLKLELEVDGFNQKGCFADTTNFR